ncbi:sodium calcium exchanger 1-like [Stylonychia lemnae]|uniref:Sodium calcium exchanger 1-like n=1 Tax=Stylonychia lemnae TaxID=5949 RepID=A0A078AW72_STYLE|nr:sodium calcium exchanger 1-like [Stylonychia lemnae]|eukprot:CDW86331.1 sodium calcium exchanger 1-like [Stylonychia lemnae]
MYVKDFIILRQKILKQKNPETKKNHETRVKIWNPAIAQLTLMVFATSAPIIVMNVIESVQIISNEVSYYNILSQYMGFTAVIGFSAFSVLIQTAIAIYAPTKEKDVVSSLLDLSVNRTKEEIYQWKEEQRRLITQVIIYGYDKFREMRIKRKLMAEESLDQTVLIQKQFEENKRKKRKPLFEEKDNPDKEIDKSIKYSTIEFFRVLVSEKKGAPLRNYDDQRKRKEMKEYLMKFLKTDDIEQVTYNELKKQLEGDSLIGRIPYRQWFGNLMQIRREIVTRQGIDNKRAEMMLLDQKEHAYFGFKCGSYSVNEAKGFVEVEILNKKKQQASIGIRTINGTAKAGEDFEKVERTLKFKKDQESYKVPIKIMDNEEWEPDEEFSVELFDVKTGYAIKGKDVRSKITIIDDDNPGVLSFEFPQKRILASEPEAKITVVRKNGCKGVISCRFKTVDVEERDKRAIPNEDYEKTEGIVEFKSSEISQQITIKLLNKRQYDPDQTGMMFGLKIFDPQPKGIVKITMKDTCQVKLELDNEFQLRQEALDQFLWTIERQANRSWESQIKQAIMLHPTLNLDGTVDDVTTGDAVVHFVTIFWKFTMALIPPPHIFRGWPAFFLSLTVICFQMLIILEFAGLFGCNTEYGGYMTSLTIISIGVSIPDLIATYQAAQHSKYADNSIMQFQCSLMVINQLSKYLYSQEHTYYAQYCSWQEDYALEVRLEDQLNFGKYCHLYF